MPIDPEKALGAELLETTFSWDESSVILYHLGLGAGTPATDSGELEYCYEANLKVLPSFASVAAFECIAGVAAVEGLDINLATLLHGGQEVTVSGPLPTSGTVTNRGRVTDIFDKGKGALVILEVVSQLANGDELFRNRASLFLRGEGGFGGESGPPAPHPEPDRSPDAVTESVTFEQQALLYRLTGDRNPLHADPMFAALGGFDRPILHGLCTYGIVCKATVDELFDGDVGAIAWYGARFSGVVLPGETIVTSMWDEGDHVIVTAVAKERAVPVITNASLQKQ